MMRDLSMHVMDIAQNSIRAEARRIEVIIDEDGEKDMLTMTFRDDGKGMSAETINRVLDPFYTSRTTRKIGLGLPMLNQTCQMCGGALTIESAVGEGTTVTASMGLSNIDRPPLGDIGETMRLFIISNEELSILYRHTVNGKTFECDADELKEALDGVSFCSPSVLGWFKEFFEEGLGEIR